MRAGIAGAVATLAALGLSELIAGILPGATSLVAVTLTQPGLIMNGHGLDAQLDAKRIQLSDVKARYE